MRKPLSRGNFYHDLRSVFPISSQSNPTLQLLTNPVYTQRIRRFNRLYLDRPLPAIDLAQFKTERVIRAKRHQIAFKRKGNAMGWVEYFNLEVFFGLGLVVGVLMK
jgi:hypothetical protein